MSIKAVPMIITEINFYSGLCIKKKMRLVRTEISKLNFVFLFFIVPVGLIQRWPLKSDV